MAEELPLSLQDLGRLRHFLRADLAAARLAQNWAAALQLQLDAQQLEAAIQYATWQHSLVLEYGEQLGRKLGAQQIEVGMTLRHVLASYGVPSAGMLLDADSETLYLHYGPAATGSRFEVRNGLVMRAVLGTPSLPTYVLNAMDDGDG